MPPTARPRSAAQCLDAAFPARLDPLMTTTLTPCRCCAKGTPETGARQCPECGHVFRGSGWDGIDAHWKSKHDGVMLYEAFWAGLCAAHRRGR